MSVGYRIEYAVRDGTMQARVSGKSSLGHATRIARDIAEEAARRAVRELLIDVRGLMDRVGTLGTPPGWRWSTPATPSAGTSSPKVLPAAAAARCAASTTGLRLWRGCSAASNQVAHPLRPRVVQAHRGDLHHM